MHDEKMKLCDLKPGERFRAELFDPRNNELVFTITGTFEGMDGMYAKVKTDSVEHTQFLSCIMEVTKCEN